MRKMFISKILMLCILTFSCLYAQEEKEYEKDQKIVITGVIPGGYAEAIDLKPGDVIVTYNGKEIHNLRELGMFKAKIETDSVEIVIKRDEEMISFIIPKGQIGVWVKELLPEIEFEKDAMIIEGIGPLGWETCETNSFIAALTRIVEYLDIQKDYTYLMGASGSGFRILFHEEWCPSSPDPTVGFDCGTVAVKSINLNTESMFDKEGINKDEMRQRIIEAIDKKMPVIAIDLIEVPEWGLIVGYQKNGEELIVRDYFGKREGYSIAEKFPWIIITVSKGKNKINDDNNFKNSFEIAQDLYETEKYEEYYSGTAALEYWIKRLKEDDFESLEEKEFNDVMLTNAWIFERLADDRQFAAEYLKSLVSQFSQVKDKINNLISIYETENKLMTDAGTVTLYPTMMEKRDDWTAEMKQKEIEVLTEVLGKEKEAYSVIKEINKKITD